MLPSPPYVDLMGHAYFTIEMKDGSGEVIHLDVNDKKLLWICIITVVNWEC